MKPTDAEEASELEDPRAPVTGPLAAATSVPPSAEDARTKDDLRRVGLSAEADALYRVLFSNSPAMMLLVDPGDGSILDASAAAVAFYGYPRDQLLRLGVGDIDTLSAEEVRRNLASIPEASGRHLRRRHRLAEGSLRDVEISSNGIRVGERVLLHAIIQDVTERARAELRLHESEQLYRSLVEASQSLVWRCDTEGHFTYLNQAWERTHGYRLDEMIGRKFSDFQSPEVAARDTEVYARNRATSSVSATGYATTHQAKDGREIQLHFSSATIQDAEGNLIGTQGTAFDVTQARQAVESLRRSRAMLARTEEIAEVGSWDWDAATGAVRWSAGLFRLFGRDPAASAPSFEEQRTLYHAEDFERLERAVADAMREGTPYELELRGLRADGEARTYLARAHAEMGPGGTATRLFGSLQDITDRKKATDALARQAHFFFEQMFVQSGISTQLLDRDGWCERVNPKLSEIFGVRPEHIEGRRYNIFQDEAIRAGGVLPHLEKVFKELEAAEWEVHFDLAVASESTHVEVSDKRKVWYWCRAYPIVDTRGQLTHVVIQHWDISARKQTEQALRESEAYNRTLFESVPEGIIVVARDGTHVDVNEAMCRMVGYRREELIGRDASTLLVPEEAHTLGQAVAALKAGADYPRAWHLRRKDGSVVEVAFSGTLLPDDRRLGLLRDMTEQRAAERETAKLEAQLNQAQKMESVGRLAGGVAHDFNNMLSVILAHAEFALEDDGPLGRHHADLAEIQKAALRSADLTRQLLAFARKQTVVPTVLDLNEGVAGMIHMLQRLIGEQITLTLKPGVNLWRLKVDRSQVDQILANLCVNGRDAIAGVGTLTIETENCSFDHEHCASHEDVVPGDYVRLAVRDDGCGMDQETQAHLFEPFFTTKPLGEGTGLGLATVYGIVKQNGGFIRVESAVGSGTTFTVYLPRYVGGDEAAVSRPSAEVLRGQEMVLLVEDEDAILRATTRMLEQVGYKVLAARTPGEALRIAREHRGDIHVLVTDVIMPEMNGRDLARSLLSLYPNLKRLFMSGYTADIIAHHGVLDPGVRFLQKPFSKADLAAKLREALRDR